MTYDVDLSMNLWSGFLLFQRNFLFWGNPFIGELRTHTQTHTERIEGDRISSHRLHYVQWDNEVSFTGNMYSSQRPKTLQEAEKCTTNPTIKHLKTNETFLSRWPCTCSSTTALFFAAWRRKFITSRIKKFTKRWVESSYVFKSVVPLPRQPRLRFW